VFIEIIDTLFYTEGRDGEETEEREEGDTGNDIGE
jgi:hypothetical protein